MNYYPLTLVLLFFLSFLDIKSQTPTVRFQHIGLEEGLSQNAVMHIVQDSTGFIWIATRDGLNRYNGYDLKVYRNDYEDSTSIYKNAIKCLKVDSKNRLWIAPENGGLILYRRKTDDFSNEFNLINGKQFSISSNIIEDDNGLLWFCVDKVGLVKYNPENKEHEVFGLLNQKQKKMFFFIKQVGDRFWITTYDSGLIMFDFVKNEVSKRTIDYENNMGIPNETRNICTDENGIVYVSTLHGIYKYIPESLEFELLEIPDFNSKYSDISAIHLENSLLWFVSKHRGLFKYNLSNNEFTFYPSNPKSKYALSHAFVTCIFQDRQNNIWAGTYGGGINKIDIDLPFDLYIHNPEDNFSLANSSSRKILKDKNGRLVVASYNGVRVFDNKKKEAFDLPYQIGNNDFESEKYSKSLASLTARALEWENDHQLWIGFEGSGIQLYDFNTQVFENFSLLSEKSTQFKSNVLSTIVKDADGIVWAGTSDGLYFKTPSDNDFQIYSLNQDQEPIIDHVFAHPEGYVFVASNFGIHFINGGEETLINCKNVSNNLIRTNCEIINRVTFITDLNDSTLILGSSGNGILDLIYNIESDSLSIKKIEIIENETIKKQTVYAIIQQNDSIIWFSTNEGLFKYNYYTDEVINYSYIDGLQGNEFNYNCYYKDDNGIMYFGGINGINSFNPNKVSLENYNTKLYYDNIQFGDSVISELHSYDNDINISIPYKDNQISIEYFGINLDRPNSINYFVQLVGEDYKPIFVGKQREVNFFNLEPGVYELRVWATNLNNLNSSNNYSSLFFFIKPPFYLMLWFKVLILLFIALLLLIGIKMRTSGLLKQKERLEKEVLLNQKKIENQKLENEIITSKAVIQGQIIEQKRISEELHDGIGHLLTAASLNISAIKSLISKGAIEKLPEEINNVSDTINQSIKEIRNISHNLMPNLLIQEGLESAINELVSRINRSNNVKLNFECEGVISNTNNETTVSIYRMIQETVNNSLKHSKASEIYIKLFQDDENVIITIGDNGIGFDQKSLNSNTGLGLKNLQARTELNRGELNITSQKGKGTIVNIVIPLD